MFCSHDICVAWAHLRLANLELVVHVGFKSVVSSFEPEQNNMLWPVQFVQAVWLEFGCCCYFDIHFVMLIVLQYHSVVILCICL